MSHVTLEAKVKAKFSHINLRNESVAAGDEDMESVTAVDVKLVITGKLSELCNFCDLSETTLLAMQSAGVEAGNVRGEYEHHQVVLKGAGRGSNLMPVTLRDCKVNKISFNMSEDDHVEGFCDVSFRVQAFPRELEEPGKLAKMLQENVQVQIKPEKDLLTGAYDPEPGEDPAD